MNSPKENPITGDTQSFELTDDQRETADRLNPLLGKIVSDRYIDFCRLSGGAIELNLPRPMAGHALRELESILRTMLSAPLDAAIYQDKAVKSRTKKAARRLRDLGFNAEEIQRACKALAPQDNQRGQIGKIVSRLGFAIDGDIAGAWMAIARSHEKAHERPFDRGLAIDDEFLTEWVEPFHKVVRAIANALQSKYVPFIDRVDQLAAMSARGRALKTFIEEIPFVQPLQWRFFQKITGPAWLPELLKRGLIAEPSSYLAQSSDEQEWRQWPVGQYLLGLAKSDDKGVHTEVIKALRSLALSRNPEVRRDGLETLAALPAAEVAGAADLASGWLEVDEAFWGTHFAEQLVIKLAKAGESMACLIIASALFRVFGRKGQITTLFKSQTYEHHLFQITPVLTEALGLDALSLFCDLLHTGAAITNKISTDPSMDFTSPSLPLPETEVEQYDIYSTLICAVLRSASQLVEDNPHNVESVLTTLMAHQHRIYKRIALCILSGRPDAAPQIANSLLLDVDLLVAANLKQEYAGLARAWFSSMSADNQQKLLSAIDAIPVEHAGAWRSWFTEFHKRLPTADDERVYLDAAFSELTFDWRHVLPADRQRAPEDHVDKEGSPDTLNNAVPRPATESPLKPSDFATMGAREIAHYLKTSAPSAALTKQTKAALGVTFRQAVQNDPIKFSEGALAFADLVPFFIARLFEGLYHAVQSKVAIEWASTLELIEAVVGRTTLPTQVEVQDRNDPLSPVGMAKEILGLVTAGLQNRSVPLSRDHAERLRSIIHIAEQIALSTTEPDDEAQDGSSGYQTAVSTVVGITAELNVSIICWLIEQPNYSEIESSPWVIAIISNFKQYVARALRDKAANGRIVRTVFGSYLSWLIHFDEKWVMANFKRVFPKANKLWEAAWLGHLLRDNRPARNFVEQMRPMYEAEIVNLVNNAADDGHYRENRCGVYLIILYLWGVLPSDVLENFLRNASDRLRSHVMQFIARDLKVSKTPHTIRAMSYWELRLAAGIGAADKEAYREELGTFSTWVSFNAVNAAWLLNQQIKMYAAGFAPNYVYGVVEWASTVVPEYPDETIEMMEALITHTKTGRFAYAGNDRAIEAILATGLASDKSTTRTRAETITSHLASIGLTHFVDFAAKMRGSLSS